MMPFMMIRQIGEFRLTLLTGLWSDELGDDANKEQWS